MTSLGRRVLTSNYISVTETIAHCAVSNKEMSHESTKKVKLMSRHYINIEGPHVEVSKRIQYLHIVEQ